MFRFSEIDDSIIPVQFYVAAIYLAQNKFDDAYTLYADTVGKHEFPGQIYDGRETVTRLIEKQPKLIFACLIKGFLLKTGGAGTKSKADLGKFIEVIVNFIRNLQII